MTWKLIAEGNEAFFIIYSLCKRIARQEERTPNADLSRDCVGSWNAYLASLAYFFAGADEITKEREPGIEIIESTP